MILFIECIDIVLFVCHNIKTIIPFMYISHKFAPVIRAIHQSATLLALFSVWEPSPNSCTSDLLRDELVLPDVFFLSPPPSLLSESLLELFVLSESLSEVKLLSSPGLGGDSGESGSGREGSNQTLLSFFVQVFFVSFEKNA